ncbi:Nif3-like dinuclear metal center hexameric protein [Candidatus Marinamargulisbacteria bacterium SCGC AG-410-N11]|nr:Nif3-like dinuclear metal center hexameric protein [Candidatus Marinamargulisbacteria bacterium SCGC AG-410-N11]
MVYLQQIIDFLDQWAPRELAAKWDSIGLQLGEPTSEIKSIVLSLDVDSLLLDTIKKEPTDLVITHHPIFFKPIRSLRYESDMGRILKLFITQNCHLFTMHTNLDAAEGGVNDCLIKAFNFEPKQGISLSDGFGKFYTHTSNSSFNDLLNLFPAKQLGYNDPKSPINRIAFCCGSGHGFIHELADLNIDCMVTGEITYHDEVFCEMNGIRVIALGHRESELFVLDEIKSRLSHTFNLPIRICS